jgi:hypothetical protein
MVSRTRECGAEAMLRSRLLAGAITGVLVGIPVFYFWAGVLFALGMTSAQAVRPSAVLSLSHWMHYAVLGMLVGLPSRWWKATVFGAVLLVALQLPGMAPSWHDPAAFLGDLRVLGIRAATGAVFGIAVHFVKSAVYARLSAERATLRGSHRNAPSR